MNILSVTALLVCASILIVSVKQYNPEMAHMTELAACVAVLLIMSSYIREVIDAVKEFAMLGKYSSKYLVPLLKITGIAYVAQIGSSLCSDCGETALAEKAEMAGKLMICALTIPMARDAFIKITEIIG